jgi:hypothetical protein
MAHFSHDVFLSYTGTDSTYAAAIHSDFQRYGANIWFDKVSMPTDHQEDPNLIRHYLRKALRESRSLLILISSRSMASPLGPLRDGCRYRADVS